MSTARSVGPADRLLVVDRDRAAVRALLDAPEPLVMPAVYHCQQAAETLVKRVLVWQGIDFSKRHDIDSLVMRVRVPLSVPFRDALLPRARFTPYATAYRYPGETTDLTDDLDASTVSGWLAEIDAVRAVVVRSLRL